MLTALKVFGSKPKFKPIISPEKSHKFAKVLQHTLWRAWMVRTYFTYQGLVMYFTLSLKDQPAGGDGD